MTELDQTQKPMFPNQKIGVIRTARFGLGGYDDAMVSFIFYVDFPDGFSTAVEYSGLWATNYPTEKGLQFLGKQAHDVCVLMRDLGCKSLDDMPGKSVIVPFDGERNLGFLVAPKTDKVLDHA